MNHHHRISAKIHRYKLAAKIMSRFIRLIPSVNLFSKSALPIALAAEAISRKSSSSRRIHRIMLPTTVGISEKNSLILYFHKNDRFFSL